MSVWINVYRMPSGEIRQSKPELTQEQAKVTSTMAMFLYEAKTIFRLRCIEKGCAHKGSMRDLTNEQLVQEWHYWNHKIETATAWGGALGAADSFRKEAYREIRRRGITIFPSLHHAPNPV